MRDELNGKSSQIEKRTEYYLHIVPGTKELQNRVGMAKKFKNSVSFLIGFV